MQNLYTYLKENKRISLIAILSCTIVWLVCYALKFKETEVYINPWLRYLLSFTFSFIGFYSISSYLENSIKVLFKKIVTKLSHKRKVIGVMSVLITLLFFLIISLETATIYSNLEFKNLVKNGKIEFKQIIDEKFIQEKGKYYHYNYYFYVDIFPLQRKKMCVKRKEYTLHINDSIPIIYLPQNPTIFREANDKDLIAYFQSYPKAKSNFELNK
jgi:hypothetical protein